MSTLKELLGMEPWQVPGHPPASPHRRVRGERLTPQGLRHRFLTPTIWQPEITQERRWGEAKPLRAAAVLVAIVTKPEPTVLLTRRTAHLPTHAGQVAFPGGKIDARDANAAAAALREAFEEVTLAPECVEVIGTMPAYRTGSGFEITPVVGLVDSAATWRADPGEVDLVFEVPLSFLMDETNHQIHHAQVLGQPIQWWSMPYDDGQERHFIWGATAAMLRNLHGYLCAE